MKSRRGTSAQSPGKELERALLDERSHLRTLLDAIPDLVWLKDPEGRFLSCNPSFERLLGASEADLVGKTDYDFVDRATADGFRAFDRRAIAAGRPSVNEEWVDFAHDGTHALLETVKTPVRDSQGRVLGVLGVARDVTRVRATAESLRQSEERLRLFIDHAPVALAMFDREMRYLSVSRRWLVDYGLVGVDLCGRCHYDVFPEIGESWKAVHRRALAGEVIACDEDAFVRADGSEQRIQWEVRPWREATGEIAGIVVFTEDVTERRLAEGRAQTQAAVSRIFADGASLPDTAARVLEAIGSFQRWPAGVIWMRDRRTDQLRPFAKWAAPELDSAELLAETEGLRYVQGEGFPAGVWESAGAAVGIDLASESARSTRAAAAIRLGFRGSIAVPVVTGEVLVAVIELFSIEGHAVAGPVREMLESIGRQFGQFVDRRRAEETVSRFVSGSPAVIYALEVVPSGVRPVWVSDNLERMTGWQTAEALAPGWWSANLHPEDAERAQRAGALPQEMDGQVVEFRFRRRDGTYLWLRDEKRLFRDAAGRPTEIVGSWTDVTSRVELERQLRTSQKLEAVGRLAGGIAHDFNNLLTVISGNCEILRREARGPGAEGARLAEIRDAAERAALLTRQLLTFSRHQVLAPQVLELDSTVRHVQAVLRRLIGEDVELTCEIASDSGHVRIDPGQLEQVIFNLAVNARDAMPHGGRLVLSSGREEIAPGSALEAAGATPGSYCRLSVIDDGCGMSPETRERIFEPFFTTKPLGRGSGLGLSTVFGIVREAGGHIEVASREGHGSRFDVYLPRVAAPTQAVPRQAATRQPQGTESILLVEDEAGVRRIARIALEKQGFRVTAVPSAEEALSLFQSDDSLRSIDLLVTDLVMSGMSGRELADRLCAREPNLAVLLMSGYVEDEIVRAGVVESQVAFLHKPFSFAELGAAVRRALDARAARGTPPTVAFDPRRASAGL